MPDESLHVAIIGGGLCGLALAIALTKRNISYTVYEARGSFTEIGAGLNLGPNAIQAFDAIDPALRDKIFALATRNAPGEEDVWFNLRFGAPTDQFRDAHPIAGIKAPPTGNMTLSRNEMLQLLANSIPPEHAKFNKKIADVQQLPDGVTMTFADGTQETASVVIGCDGAHSAVRRIILGSSHPAATPTFSHTGGYRAVLPMRVHESVVGLEIARSSQVFCGPGAYVIMYPINNGENVNIGFWKRVEEEWEADGWVLHNQKQQMLKDFEDWGETVHRVMECMSEETQFWATFHYEVFPERYCKGRVGVIGDGAHAMCPHQGQGAAQAMEDASVMAEVLAHIEPASASSEIETSPLSTRIAAALQAFECARKERFEKVARTSHEVFDLWADFLRDDLTQEDVEEFERYAYERLQWLWDADVVGQSQKAVAEMDRMLERLGKVEMNGGVKLN